MKSLLLILMAAGLVAGKSTSVRGHVKKDGKYVAPHVRSGPNKTQKDNYSTKGNVNPNTGKAGKKTPTK